ncbi:MAG: PaaI family thioesterase [Mycobacterium sp.]
MTSPLGRLGVQTFEDGAQRCSASIPVARLVNPLTGIPTVATMAMIVDHVGGLLNHRRCGPDEYTVSSELSLELTPEAAALIDAAPDTPVLTTSRPLGTKNASALAACELALDGHLVGTASVRSFYIRAPGNVAGEWAVEPADEDRPETLADQMSVRVAEGGGTSVLVQSPDPAINNAMGIVHGGISATALELVASAALNNSRVGSPLHTASLRVNYLRPFRSGADARYVGTALRAGRSTGVSDAQAIGADGAVAIAARLTAYL